MVCDYLSMLGLKLNHVSKSGHGSFSAPRQLFQNPQLPRDQQLSIAIVTGMVHVLRGTNPGWKEAYGIIPCIRNETRSIPHPQTNWYCIQKTVVASWQFSTVLNYTDRTYVKNKCIDMHAIINGYLLPLRSSVNNNISSYKNGCL